MTAEHGQSGEAGNAFNKIMIPLFINGLVDGP
jgi:hypothetical protein